MALAGLVPQIQKGALHGSRHWRYGNRSDTLNTSEANYDEGNPLGLSDMPYTTPIGSFGGQTSPVGCFDMSQAELRVAAHFSKDPELLACYSSDPEIDVHAGTLQLLHTLGWASETSVVYHFSTLSR